MEVQLPSINDPYIPNGKIHKDRALAKVGSLRWPGYGLPPTSTSTVRSLMHIQRPSRLEARAFVAGICDPTTRRTILPTEMFERHANARANRALF